MDIEDKLNQHERDIGRIEGKLESLATKEFVRKEVNDAVRILDAKIDKQTEDISDKFQKLSDKIKNERRWRMKITGAASVLALVFVAISSLISTLISLGIIAV